MKKTFVVAINGISGGGKTIVTNELLKELPNSEALYFDDRDYDLMSGIGDICEWVENGADANRFNLDLLAGDIELLLKRTPDFILLDYPFGRRHNLIGKYIDLSVFIDTPLDVALARRIIRDCNETESLNIISGMKHYLSCGRKAYISGIDIGIADADLVVDGNRSVNDVVSIVKQGILPLYSRL